MAYQTPPEFHQPRNNTFSKVLIVLLVIVLCFGAGGLGAWLVTRKSGSSTSSGLNINTGQHINQSEISAVDVSNVVDAVKPTVVEITTESVSYGGGLFGQYVAQGAGSGVIMSSDGYIITNHHVVEDARNIKVKLVDGSEYDATLVGSDPQTDLAVIKVNAKNLTPATFGNSNDLKVGDIAIAIGNPLGSLGGTVTTGIISALDRQIDIDNVTMNLLQTDAAINPGNSGGGLFDASGNLIGIVNAKQSASGIEGLGFAIPISDAVDVLQELIENGAITSRPVLGVSLQELTTQNGAPAGLYIIQVQDGSSAQEAGLQPNDRILTFDGKDIETVSELKAILNKKHAGDTVDMVIERDGKEQTVPITLKTQS